MKILSKDRLDMLQNRLHNKTLTWHYQQISAVILKTLKSWQQWLWYLCLYLYFFSVFGHTIANSKVLSGYRKIFAVICETDPTIRVSVSNANIPSAENSHNSPRIYERNNLFFITLWQLSHIISFEFIFCYFEYLFLFFSLPKSNKQRSFRIPNSIALGGQVSPYDDAGLLWW